MPLAVGGERGFDAANPLSVLPSHYFQPTASRLDKETSQTKDVNTRYQVLLLHTCRVFLAPETTTAAKTFGLGCQCKFEAMKAS